MIAPRVAAVGLALLIVASLIALAAAAAGGRAATSSAALFSSSGLVSRQEARGTCPEAPMLEGKSLSSLIEGSQGMLIIGMPNMRCTLAARGQAEAHGVPYEFREFSGPFLYEPGASDVWDYLHCRYPDDLQGGTIMHSYVFQDGTFVGQGFAAAEELSSGRLAAGAGGRKGRVLRR